MLRWVWKLVSGPQLFKVYQNGEIPSHIYEGNIAERSAHSVLKWIRICWTVCTWTSPFILLISYRRGAFSSEGLQTLLSYSTSLCLLLVTVYGVRAIGRITNQEYREFLSTLMTYQQNLTAKNKARLSKYDCCFSAWPVEYAAPVSRERSHRNSTNSKISFPLYVLSYACVRTFGIRLLYPGCVSMFQNLIGQALLDGREKLIMELNGIRSKIRTSDGNDIDTMFVDRRRVNQEKGNILVICCEGNAGFYEMGCSGTPLDAGYSVLAWNHPGFSGSTGCPLPDQERRAMDAVIQYSINHLGFTPSDIILFAWSIGGYTAAWGAMMYPDVRCTILDATFDNILPLAIARMPASWKSLIELAMPQHLNLDNAELLCNYSGKVVLIRRSKDEMITTSESDSLSTNRGNDLLECLLKHRYPRLFDSAASAVLQEWLACGKNEQNDLWESFGASEEACEEEILKYTPKFPSDIGDDLDARTKEQFIIFLAKRYMLDYDSTHCTPLPSSFFREPKTLL